MEAGATDLETGSSIHEKGRRIFDHASRSIDFFRNERIAAIYRSPARVENPIFWKFTSSVMFQCRRFQELHGFEDSESCCHPVISSILERLDNDWSLSDLGSPTATSSVAHRPHGVSNENQGLQTGSTSLRRTGPSSARVSSWFPNRCGKTSTGIRRTQPSVRAKALAGVFQNTENSMPIEHAFPAQHRDDQFDGFWFLAMTRTHPSTENRT